MKRRDRRPRRMRRRMATEFAAPTSERPASDFEEQVDTRPDSREATDPPAEAPSHVLGPTQEDRLQTEGRSDEPKPDLPGGVSDESSQAPTTTEKRARWSAMRAAAEGRVEHPMDEELLCRAAREAAEAGDLKRATGIYRELLAVSPTHLRARNNLALILDQMGEREGALAELDRCLKQDPSNVQVLVNRGGIMGAHGRHAEAESDLNSALKVDPGNAEAHYNLGLVTIRRGLWGAAVTSLKRAIELDSSQAGAYFYLGEALNHIDDLPGALQAYQQAAELQPTNTQAFYGIGIILDRMNRPEDAAQMYRRSREITGR